MEGFVQQCIVVYSKLHQVKLVYNIIIISVLFSCVCFGIPQTHANLLRERIKQRGPTLLKYCLHPSHVKFCFFQMHVLIGKIFSALQRMSVSTSVHMMPSPLLSRSLEIRYMYRVYMYM